MSRPFSRSSTRGRYRLLYWLEKKGLSRKKLKKRKLFKLLGPKILDTNYWIPTQKGVSRAWLIGILWGLSPLFGISFILCIPFVLFFRSNIPLTFFILNINNVLVAPFYYSLCYWVGSRVWGSPLEEITEWSFKVFMEKGWEIFGTVSLGCLLISLPLGILGFFAIKLLWKLPPKKA